MKNSLEKIVMSFLFLQSLTIFAGGDAVLLNEEAAEVAGRESHFFGNGVDGLAGLVLEETAGLGEADGVDVGGEGEASGVVGKELVEHFATETSMAFRSVYNVSVVGLGVWRMPPFWHPMRASRTLV